MNIRPYILFVFIILLSVTGCVHKTIIGTPADSVLYSKPDNSGQKSNLFTPHILVHGYSNIHNRIGRPSARFNKWGEEEIYIDTNYPTLYHGIDTFTTERDEYTNHIYRVNFPKTPFSLIPFYLTSGNNPGLLVITTYNSDHNPVLITTVHTCGCYLAIIPTNFLPKESLPLKWKNEDHLKIYGEQLPSLIDFTTVSEPSLVFEIRPETHRFMNIELINKYESNQRYGNVQPMLYAELDSLEKIPLRAEETSFFVQNGILEGHVKDSIKPWESTLLSLISLDLFVGSDKKYDYHFKTKNNFYTSLKPWNRVSSDMRNFKRFLRFWGWRL